MNQEEIQTMAKEVGGNGDTPVKAPIIGEVAWADPMRLFAGSEKIQQYNPSLLITRKGYQILDKMRKDDQVKVSMKFKKHAVFSTGYEITAPDGVPIDWEPKVYLEQCFEHMDGSLYKSLLEALTGLDYGFSVTEKIYDSADIGFGKQVVLKAMKTRKPHSFELIADEFGNLKTIKQYQLSGGWQLSGEGIELPVEKFILFVNDMEWGNWYGESDLESAYRPWWIKDNSYKWYAMLLERRGIPPIFALYDPNQFQAGLVDNLKEVMESIQAATTGVIPRATPQGLEFWAPQLAKEASDVFQKAIDMFNRDIARSILMPGLLGFTPDQAEGSYARSKVHFDVFMMVVEFLRGRIEDEIMFEQVIKPLIDYNYPGIEEYPKFKFHPLTEEVRLDLMDRWITAVEKGVVVTQLDDEEHIRTVLGFPEKVGTEVAPGPNPPAPEEEEVDEEPVDDEGEEEPPIADGPKYEWDDENIKIITQSTQLEEYARGNFGHKGRPGKVGGSSKGGGSGQAVITDKGDERIAKIDKELPYSPFERGNMVIDKTWVKGTNDIEKKAIDNYAQNGYKRINKTLRSGSGDSEEIQALTNSLDRASLPIDVVVRRGFGRSSDLISSLKEGDVFQDKGFISTTVGFVGQKFKSKTQAEILLPKGSKAAHVNGLSRISLAEQEVLIQRGSKFKVVGRREKGGVTYVQMELVGASVEYSFNFSLSRTPNKYEQRIDFTRIENRLQQLEDITRKELIQLLTESRDALVGFVGRNWKDIAKMVGDLRLKGWDDVQSTLGEFLKQAYDIGTQEMNTELGNIALEFAKGNWGHKGRPGMVGGSGGSGGGSSVPSDFDKVAVIKSLKEQKLDMGVYSNIKPVSRSSAFGQCTQNTLKEYKENGTDVYVGTVVKSTPGSRYMEAKEKWEATKGTSEETIWPTEAFPHAWNVKDGKIIDKSFGSKEAENYTYFGFKVPPEELVKISNGNELANWYSKEVFTSGMLGEQEFLEMATVRGPMFTPKDALKFLRDKNFYISSVLKDSLLKEAKAIIYNAIKVGEIPTETQQKLNQLFEPYIGNEDVLKPDRDGVMRATEPYRIETVLRTNATEAFNQGRVVEGRRLGKFVQGFQYSAIIDARTTEICTELDGRIFRSDDPQLNDLTPPNHFSCRSLLVAVPLGVEVDNSDFITGEEIGRVKDLMQPGFGGNVTKLEDDSMKVSDIE